MSACGEVLGEGDDQPSAHGGDRIWNVALGSQRRRRGVGDRRERQVLRTAWRDEILNVMFISRAQHHGKAASSSASIGSPFNNLTSIRIAATSKTLAGKHVAELAMTPNCLGITTIGRGSTAAGAPLWTMAAGWDRVLARLLEGAA
jgi:hypothetical protein